MEAEILNIFEPLRRLLIFGISAESKIADSSTIKYLDCFKMLERVEMNKQKKTNNEHTFLELKNLSDELKNIDKNQFTEVYNSFNVTAAFIRHLIKEGNGQTVLNTLKQASALQYSCKENIILCLATLTKVDQKELVTAAYSAVPEICTSSYLFLLFLQCCKVLAYEHKSSGWGRGLRRAVRNWYLRWDPCKLALEISRSPKAFTWSHQDIIRLSHIKPKELPEGTQAVLHYIHSGLESTVKEFNEKTPEVVSFLKSLHAEDKNVDAMISKAKFILDKYSNISLRDFSSLNLQPEVWTFLLKNARPPLITEALHKTDILKAAYSNIELKDLLLSTIKLDSFSSENDLVDLVISYNACRRKAIDIKEAKDGKVKSKAWKKNAAPDPERDTKLREPKLLPEQLTPVIDALGDSISANMKNSEKTKSSAAIFIEMNPNMKDFVRIGISDPPREIRVVQAASLVLQSLTADNWDTITPYFFTKSGPGTMFIPSPCGIHYLKTNMKNIVPGPVDVEAALNKCFEPKKESCIVLCRNIDATILKAATEALKDLKKEQKIRLIVCGMSISDGIELPSCDTHPDLCFVVGFTRRTIPFIKAYHERVI